MLGVAVALALAGFLVMPALAPDPKPRYETAEVKKSDLRATVTATGRLRGLNTVEVGAEVSGRLTRVWVNYNDHVEKGQVLAEIDSEQSQAAVDEATAQLAVALANIAQAQATLEETNLAKGRAEQQATQGLVSQRDLEAARAAAARAAANLAAAKANETLVRASLTSARSRLRKTTVVAPMSGVVLARLVEPGQTVTAGFQTPVLFKLAEDLARMQLFVDIDEADVGAVKVNQDATFTVDAYPGREFPSKLIELRNDAKISSNVVTYEGVLEVNNDDGLLRPGMTATATIITQSATDVLVVPNAALRFKPPRAPHGPFMPRAKEPALDVPPLGSQRVWVQDAEGNAKPRLIKVGVTNGQLTEVIGSDLEVGMQVVINQISRDK
jgi:HlyD family secretion protein